MTQPLPSLVAFVAPFELLFSGFWYVVPEDAVDVVDPVFVVLQAFGFVTLVFALPAAVALACAAIPVADGFALTVFVQAFAAVALPFVGGVGA